MNHTISDKTLEDFKESISDLDKLLTERIQGMNNVPELLQARHVYIFYRKLLWESKDIIVNGIKEEKK